MLALSIGMVFLNGIGSESQGYRAVPTFLALGVLLLGVSFAYQKDWLRLRNEVPSEQVRKVRTNRSRVSSPEGTILT